MKLRKKESIKEIIDELKKKGKREKQRFWKDIAERLEKPRRIRAAVNISKLEKLYEKCGDKIFFVPGKVIGKSELKKPIKVCALSFSAAARENILQNGGAAYTFKEILKQDIKGKDVMIAK